MSKPKKPPPGSNFLPGWVPEVLAIMRLHGDFERVMARQLKAVCRENGLTERGQLILSLVDRDHDRPAKLIEVMDVLPSTITFETDKLVAAGLITREALPGDRRVVHLKLTPKGRAVNRQIAKLLSALFKPTIGALEPGELDQFLAIGRKILPSLETVQAPPPQAKSKPAAPMQPVGRQQAVDPPRRSRARS